MQWFRFNTRSRKPGESVATYVAELRRLAEFCNLKQDATGHIINNDNIQKKLLSEPTLMYTRALEISQGTEEVEKNIREMRAPQHESDKTGPQVTSRQNPYIRFHPILQVEDLFAMLQRGKRFTKLNLSQAYQQLTLHLDSRKYFLL